MDNYVIARDGELPAGLERKAWGTPIEGLLITSGATLFIANLVDLSSMSTMGSAGFLLIFASVNGANWVLAKDTRSKSWLSLTGVVLCLGALASLLWQTAKSSPRQLGVLFVMAGAAFLIEIAFRMTTKRIINLPKNEKDNAA